MLHSKGALLEVQTITYESKYSKLHWLININTGNDVFLWKSVDAHQQFYYWNFGLHGLSCSCIKNPTLGDEYWVHNPSNVEENHQHSHVHVPDLSYPLWSLRQILNGNVGNGIVKINLLWCLPMVVWWIFNLTTNNKTNNKQKILQCFDQNLFNRKKTLNVFFKNFENILSRTVQRAGILIRSAGFNFFWRQ